MCRAIAAISDVYAAAVSSILAGSLSDPGDFVNGEPNMSKSKRLIFASTTAYARQRCCKTVAAQSAAEHC